MDKNESKIPLEERSMEEKELKKLIHTFQGMTKVLLFNIIRTVVFASFLVFFCYIHKCSLTGYDLEKLCRPRLF